MMKRFFCAALMATLVVGASANVIDQTNRVFENGNAKDITPQLDKIMERIDFGRIADSIEVDFTDWKTCGNKIIDIPGFATTYDEPILIADYTTAPLKIPSLGISFDASIAENGYTRKGISAIHNFGHVSLVKFPFLGMVMDSKFLCLEKGDVDLLYLSAFDPLYDGMFTNMVFADINAFFSPELMLLGLPDCISASVDSMLSPLNTLGQENNRLRLSLPHYLGCWNSFPMGGWSHNSDPIVAGATAVGFSLATCMRFGAISKTVRIKGLDGSLLPDTMCGPASSPQVFVKPQFLFQLVIPTASATVPIGATAPKWAEFKNKPDSADESTFWIFQRKTFYMGAAKCSKK